MDEADRDVPALVGDLCNQSALPVRLGLVPEAEQDADDLQQAPALVQHGHVHQTDFLDTVDGQQDIVVTHAGSCPDGLICPVQTLVCRIPDVSHRIGKTRVGPDFARGEQPQRRPQRRQFRPQAAGEHSHAFLPR